MLLPRPARGAVVVRGGCLGIVWDVTQDGLTLLAILPRKARGYRNDVRIDPLDLATIEPCSRMAADMVIRVSDPIPVKRSSSQIVRGNINAQLLARIAVAVEREQRALRQEDGPSIGSAMDRAPIGCRGRRVGGSSAS